MTIFLGAFLLFLVQPLLGKAILPAFGGTPAVWLTCLVLFQVLLLLGYLYAFLLHRLRSPLVQGLVHAGALAAMLWWLPILPAKGFVPGDAEHPVTSILLQLARSVGAPFLVLAATGPLLQGWYVRRFPGRSPYRLYALSNAGSLLALLGYPLLVEPALPLGEQARLWGVALLAFAVLCGTWAWRACRAGPVGQPAAEAAVAVEAPTRPAALTVQLWLALSACGSALLLATTSQISQNVASVPLLWVVPLALYLITYILAFERPRWRSRGVSSWMMALALPLAAGTLGFGHALGIALQIVGLCSTLFATCLACHGELARLAPHPRHLTAFYLAISAGGALGSALVAVVAPQVFEVVLEFPVALAASGVVVMLARRHDVLLARARAWSARPARRVLVAVGVLALLAALPSAASASWRALLGGRNVLAITRNFYGVLFVSQVRPGRPGDDYLKMTHGTTLHGLQFQAPGRRRVATAYYGAGSGVDAALSALRRRRPDPLRVGVIGMGAGTIAAWMEAGDRLVFYEINPDVVHFADSWFTFRADAVQRGATVDVVLGDARLTLQEQLDEGGAQGFDLLVVDAFSSDAIPVHLLTDECAALYERHLAPDGLLAFHVSNRFLDLASVVRTLAGHRGRAALQIIGRGDGRDAVVGSEWVLVPLDEGLALEPALAAAATPWAPRARPLPVWTDEYSSLWPALK